MSKALYPSELRLRKLLLNASSNVKDGYCVVHLQRAVTGVWSFSFSVAVRHSVRTLPCTIGWWLQCQMLIVWRLWGRGSRSRSQKIGLFQYLLPHEEDGHEGDHLLPGQACFWACRCHVWVRSVWNNSLDSGFSNSPI